MADEVAARPRSRRPELWLRPRPPWTRLLPRPRRGRTRLLLRNVRDDDTAASERNGCGQQPVIGCPCRFLAGSGTAEQARRGMRTSSLVVGGSGRGGHVRRTSVAAVAVDAACHDCMRRMRKQREGGMRRPVSDLKLAMTVRGNSDVPLTAATHLARPTVISQQAGRRLQRQRNTVHCGGADGDAPRKERFGQQGARGWDTVTCRGCSQLRSMEGRGRPLPQNRSKTGAVQDAAVVELGRR